MENPSGRVRLAGIDVLKDLDLLRTDVFPGGADVTVPDRAYVLKLLALFSTWTPEIVTVGGDPADVFTSTCVIINFF